MRSLKQFFSKKVSVCAGFTIVEMLVVMTVLVTVGSIILGIFVISLQGTNSSNSQQHAQENGRYALTQISRFIKFAKSFDGVRVIGEEDFTVDCTDPELAEVEYSELQVTGFDEGVTVFACVEDPDTQTYSLASRSASFDGVEEHESRLLNPSVVTVRKCHFTCTQSSPATPPTIGITFEIFSNANKDAIIPFHTTVVPRNY